MKLWIYAFFMTWGMFLTIPCPWKIWDERARSRMMVCLPLVGLVPGAIWAGLAWLLPRIGCPIPLQGAILAAAPFLTTGFMHLDGFMDVCDAVLSRRDLETRRKILKDSHCGAFAVICLVLLVMVQWSLFQTERKLPLLALLCLPCAVRACAGIGVLTLPPMETSQYAAMERKKNGGKIAALLLMLVLSAGIPIVFLGTMGLAPLIGACGYGLALLGAYRNLKGMSGDISGFALTLGELAGVAALTLIP